MASPGTSLPLPSDAVLVHASPQDPAPDQPEDEVCANYHILCARAEQDQTPILMPNYIELV